MWSLTPMYSIVLANLSWFFILWGKIWFQPFIDKNHTSPSLGYQILRGGVLILLSFLGFLLIDISLRMWITDLIHYGSFAPIIAPSLLCGLLGLFYVIVAVFIAPTRITLVGFVSMMASYLYYSFKSNTYSDLYPTLIIVFSVVLASSIGVKILKNTSFSHLLWDQSLRFQKKMTNKVYVLILLLLNVELILAFEGLSLFIWI